MPEPTRLQLACAVAAVTAAWSPLAALGQVFPAKPVRMIIGFPAGSSSDVVGRLVAQKMSEGLGQQVIFENRPGAGGNIGAEFIAKSPADGYALLYANTGLAVAVSAYDKLGYDALRDLVPVGQAVAGPHLLIVNLALPVQSVKDLIALAKARPGQLTFGAASGGTPHMAGELFKLVAKVDLLFVPYKGEGPAIADAMGGQISMVFSNLPVALPQAQSGRLRGLAVTSLQRVATAPDIPTAAESGLPGYEANTWFGLFAPANTPREIVSKLNADAKTALSGADVKERMAGQGLFVVANTTEQFADFLKMEIPKWAKIVKEAGVKPQ